MDDKFERLYETLEWRFKHVSKSFDAKFEKHSVVFSDSQKRIVD